MNRYKVVVARSGKEDIKERKKYILDHFKYRELAENFSKKIKKALISLETLPTGYNTSGFVYRGYDVYFKSFQTYIIFFIVEESTKTVVVLRVLQDGQNWKYIIRKWIKGY